MSSTAGAEYIGGVKRAKGFASTWNRVEWERTDRHVSSESRPRFVNQDSPGRSQESWVSSSGEEKAFPHAEGEREHERAPVQWSLLLMGFLFMVHIHSWAQQMKTEGQRLLVLNLAWISADMWCLGFTLSSWGGR